MVAVLNLPVLAHPVEQLLSRGSFTWQAGETADDFIGRFAASLDAPFDLKDLLDIRPAVVEIQVEFAADANRAHFVTAMPLFDGLCLALRKPVVRRLAETEADVLVKRTLVAFGNQQIVAAAAPDLAAYHGLCMQGVGGDECPLQRLPFEPVAKGRRLVPLACNRNQRLHIACIDIVDAEHLLRRLHFALHPTV